MSTAPVIHARTSAPETAEQIRERDLAAARSDLQRKADAYSLVLAPAEWNPVLLPGGLAALREAGEALREFRGRTGWRADHQAALDAIEGVLAEAPAASEEDLILGRLPKGWQGMEEWEYLIDREFDFGGQTFGGLQVRILWRWDEDEWIAVQPVALCPEDLAETNDGFACPPGFGVRLTPDEIATARAKIDLEHAARGGARAQGAYRQARANCFS